MPYFKNNKINILLIHIPKTGGSSIEKYFFKKYPNLIQKKNTKLWGLLPDEDQKKTINIRSSLQHLTLRNIMKNNHYFKINFTNLQIITVVRNPYDRIISELFYNNHVEINDSPGKVFKVILHHFKEYKKNNHHQDNHYRPQHLFLTDKDGKVNKNITILKTESLNEDMKKLGFHDFGLVYNKSYHKPSAFYLNKKSIRLINAFYEKDFKLFGYEKIKIDTSASEEIKDIKETI
jgi:hypothetical protein